MPSLRNAILPVDAIAPPTSPDNPIAVYEAVVWLLQADVDAKRDEGVTALSDSRRRAVLPELLLVRAQETRHGG
jgi:hypothetical protein